jgi:hypothetical protein
VNCMRFILLTALLALGTTPVFAQRGHAGGGPPGGGPGGGGMGASGSHGADMGGGNATTAPNGHGSAGMMNAAPADVLSHNTAIAGKIKTLTGEDASTACGGFKNLGQCVAAAHVAKNLDIPGGFDALKAKMTGTRGVNLGKAIEQLAPSANAKTESKKANKQAEQDLNESSS